MTVQDAARRLGRSVRSLRTYQREGLLRTRRVAEDGRLLLHREDVEALALELGTDAPAQNRKSFARLHTRLERLEQDMSIVRRTLGVKDNPLRPGSQEARELHRQAGLALEKGAWAAEEMGVWAGIFDRLDEAALEEVGKAAGLENPWETFYRLCLAQLRHLWPLLEGAPDLRELHQKLDEGLKRLRAMGILWVQTGRGKAPENLHRPLVSEREDLLRRLGVRPAILAPRSG